MAKKGAEKHAWRFFRAGGVDQVVLRDGADIGRLADLDQKLWVALACPTEGVAIDARTLFLIDTDEDKRIRPPELIAAIGWASKVFKNLDILLDDGDTLALDALSNSADGKAIRASAKRILADRGKSDATSITLEDVTGLEDLINGMAYNGDGIVPPESVESADDRKVVEEVIATLGGVKDRGGNPGVDRPHLEKFFAEVDAFMAWDVEGAAEGLLPLGVSTSAAVAAVAAIQPKVDDYFTRCRVAAFDARGTAALNAPESDLLALASLSLNVGHEAVERLPLSRVEAGRALPLEAGVNPAWAARVRALSKDALDPLLGGARTTLGETDWAVVVDKLAAHRAWASKKPTLAIDTLSADRIRALSGPSIREALFALVDRDAQPRAEYEMIAAVEKAVRFRRHLGSLLRNFVNFADFYGGRGASFQAGTLYLDARSCELVVEVANPAKHATLAGLSGAYLAYCECSRKSGEKKTIVAAFTAGDTDDLMVGRNGVFYDRDGADWDATITTVIENPISIRQAFFTPYKRLVRLVEEQIAKRAAAKEKAASADLETAAHATANADSAADVPPAAPVAPVAPAAPAPAAPAAPGAPVPAPPKKIDVGMIAAIGVAVAGVATFASTVLATFLGLGWWMPVGILALILAISGPSMLIAWLKLRRRNLGPILDANGWAVNNRAKINVPFGRSLTHLAKLPEGATRALDDPFAEQPTRWRRWVFLGVVLFLALFWFLGKFDGYLPDKARASVVLHRSPPPPPPTPAPVSTAK